MNKYKIYCTEEQTKNDMDNKCEDCPFKGTDCPGGMWCTNTWED